MKTNVEKVLERDTKLSELDDRAGRFRLVGLYRMFGWLAGIDCGCLRRGQVHPHVTPSAFLGHQMSKGERVEFSRTRLDVANRRFCGLAGRKLIVY